MSTLGRLIPRRSEAGCHFVGHGQTAHTVRAHVAIESLISHEAEALLVVLGDHVRELDASERHCMRGAGRKQRRVLSAACSSPMVSKGTLRGPCGGARVGPQPSTEENVRAGTRWRPD